MSAMTYGSWILLGLITGVCSGVFGIGGGVVLVPLLVWIGKMPQQNASATSLVALLLPVGVLGVWEYYRAGRLSAEHIQAGLTIAVGILIGTALGARLAMPIPDWILRRGFALLLVVAAARLWYTP